MSRWLLGIRNDADLSTYLQQAAKETVQGFSTVQVSVGENVSAIENLTQDIGDLDARLDGVENTLNDETAGIKARLDTLEENEGFDVSGILVELQELQGVVVGKADTTYVDTGLAGKANTEHTHSIGDVMNLQTTLDGKASTSALNAKADVTHTHVISDVTNLQVALDAKASMTYVDTGFAGKADSTHTHAIADVTGLETTLNGKADTTYVDTGLAGKADSSHTHAIADVTNLQTSLDGKADTTHTHAIADVTNLQTTLNGKANTTHTHAIADVTGLQTSLDSKFPLYSYTGGLSDGGTTGFNIGTVVEPLLTGGGWRTGKISVNPSNTNADFPAILDIDMVTTNNRGAVVRFYRATNTTGTKNIIFHRGDGTNAIDANIGVNGTNTYFNGSGGNFGIRNTAPAALLHVTQTGTDGTPALRVDDEAGDTTYLFVDQTGKVKINTNIYNTDDENLVVHGTTRLKGNVFLDGETTELQLTRPMIHNPWVSTIPNPIPRIMWGTGSTNTNNPATISFGVPNGFFNGNSVFQGVPPIVVGPAMPRVFVQITGGEAGFAEIDEVSNTGFTITTRNMNGAGSPRTFEWVAFGFGTS